MTSHPAPQPAVAAAPLPPGRLRLVILAMSLGAFAIGTTEFASMGQIGRAHV